MEEREYFRELCMGVLQADKNIRFAGVIDDSGKLLVVSWGGTFGAVRTAVETSRSKGLSVAHAHLRYLNPFPRNLGEVLAGFETVIVPEMNLGQLCTMIRAKYLVDAVPFSKVKGRPFQIREIVRKVEEYL